jgi:hypothetical protein
MMLYFLPYSKAKLAAQNVNSTLFAHSEDWGNFWFIRDAHCKNMSFNDKNTQEMLNSIN